MPKWRKRVLSVVIAASTGGFLVATATPASAQGGCKEFGQLVAAGAKVLRPQGQFVKTQAPVNEEIHTAQAEICGGTIR